jgi:tRNA pseudouridine55 synthase
MARIGILNVRKPSGLTSRDVVDRVERFVHPAKAGHAGTLDPLAMGVLVVCVGQATRLIQYVQRMPKHYRATFLLGKQSETDDIEGPVVEIPNAIEPTRDALELATGQFIGQIAQRPPAHSAIKIAGRRAYHLARRGADFQLPARPVTIHEIKIVRYDYPEVELDIACGSGTYIRALGRDMGAALGTAAVMSSLERTAIGPFTLKDSFSLEKLDSESLKRHLQPALSAVADLPRIELTEMQLIEIRHGRPISVPGIPENFAELAAVDAHGQLVAILREKRIGELWPVLNFDG